MPSQVPDGLAKNCVMTDPEISNRTSHGSPAYLLHRYTTRLCEGSRTLQDKISDRFRLARTESHMIHRHSKVDANWT